MPVAEPGGDLWPLVKAQSGWPQTDEDGVRALAAGWRGQGDAFINAGRFDLGELETGWPDPAGQAYRTRAGAHLSTAARTGSEMMELGRRADAYANQVASVKTAINDLIAANNYPYSTTEPAFRGRFVQQVAVMVNDLMNQGVGNVGAIGGAPLARAEAPPAGADPQAVREWWNGVPTASQEALVRENPDAIRNLDGVPAEVRDRANRAVLDRELGVLREQQAELVRQDQGLRNAPGYRPEVYGERIAAVDARIAGLESLRATNAEDGRPRLLLGLDTAGDGQAIVAIGNPDTARNVATVVPGTFAELGGIQGEVARAERLQASSDANTAVVAWVGYDAPDSILPEAADTSFADAGSADLARFQDGLRATHVDGQAHQTVVAHSYGTTLVGHTARDHGLNADDVVLVASPGTGTYHVSEFQLDGVPPDQVGDRVYAITAPDDPIRLSHIRMPVSGDTPVAVEDPHEVYLGHNVDPTDSQWGGTTLGALNQSADRHGGYFDSGSLDLDTIGGIIAPEYPRQ